MKIFQKLKFNLALILENGLYLLIFLLPLQTRLFLKETSLGGAFWEYGSVSIYLFDILLLLLFSISMVEIIRTKRRVELEKTWYFLAIFELFVFVSIFFASSKSMAIYGYLKIIFGFCLFYSITKIKFNDKKLTFAFLSSVFFQSLLGIWQFIFNFSFASKYLGIAEHNPEVLGTFVIELEDGTRVLRAYGGLEHPNIYAFYIFLGIFIFVRYLLKFKNKNSSIKNQIIYFAVLSVFFFSFLLSFSRSAFLLFIFYIFFLFFWAWYDKERRVNIFKIFISFLFVFAISSLFFGNLFLQRIDSKARLENISNQERITQLENSKNIILKNVLFGVGINNYTDKLRLEDEEEKEAWNYQPVHDVYFLSLAEIGIFGYISFGFLFVYFLYRCFQKKLFFDIFLIFSLLFLFLFDHWLWSLHFGVLLMFFVLALVEKRFRA